MTKPRKLPNWILIGSALLAIAMASYGLLKKSEKSEAMKAETTKKAFINNFNKELIPQYQKKSAVIKKYFTSKESLAQLKPILDLIDKWDAKSNEDIKNMVEIAGYLDQRLPNNISNLDEKSKKSFLKDLEPIERKIREWDQTYNPIQNNLPKI
jgi:hypothetical protein